MLSIIGDQLVLNGEPIARFVGRLCSRDEDALQSAVERANTPPPDFDAWRDHVIEGLTNEELVEMVVDRGLRAAVEDEICRRQGEA